MQYSIFLLSVWMFLIWSCGSNDLKLGNNTDKDKTANVADENAADGAGDLDSTTGLTGSDNQSTNETDAGDSDPLSAGLDDAANVDEIWLPSSDDKTIEASLSSTEAALKSADDELDNVALLDDNEAAMLAEVLDNDVSVDADSSDSYDEDAAVADPEADAAETDLAGFTDTGLFDDTTLTGYLTPLSEADESVDLEQPFDDANYVAEEDDAEDNDDEVADQDEDVVADLMTVDDFETMDDQEVKFLLDGEGGGDDQGTIAPVRTIKEKLLYTCTNKPCRLKKISFISKTKRGPIRAIVVEKKFVYSTKRGARDGDLNDTKAFRKDANGKRGRSAWVFVVVKKKYKFKHGSLKEVVRREYFENRNRNTSFNLVRVISNPRKDVKRLVIRRNFNQKALAQISGDDPGTTIAEVNAGTEGAATTTEASGTATTSESDAGIPSLQFALRDGNGETRRVVVFKNDKRRTKIVKFTRTNGIDAGTISGKDLRGRKRAGTFELDHKGNLCNLNDVGTYNVIITYPAAPVTADPNPSAPPKPVKQRITTKVDKKISTTNGVLTLSNDTKREKNREETIVKPEACGEDSLVVRSKITGTRYTGAEISLTKVRWNITTHIFGEIPRKDGTVKKVDFFRFAGMRLGKRFQ